MSTTKIEVKKMSIAEVVWTISFITLLFSCFIAELSQGSIMLDKSRGCTDKETMSACINNWTFFYLSAIFMLISGILIAVGFYSKDNSNVLIVCGFVMLLLSFCSSSLNLYFSNQSNNSETTVTLSIIMAVIVVFIVFNPWFFNSISRFFSKGQKQN